MKGIQAWLIRAVESLVADRHLLAALLLALGGASAMWALVAVEVRLCESSLSSPAQLFPLCPAPWRTFSLFVPLN